MLAGMLTRMLTMAAPALNAMTAKRDNAFMPCLYSLVLILIAAMGDERKPCFRREPPRCDATRFGELCPAARCLWQASPRQGNSGSSKPQIEDCCNALIIACASREEAHILL